MGFFEGLARIGFAIIQMGFVLALAPLVQGFIKTLKARRQFRLGPALLQPYYDILKYFSRGEVVSEHTSWISRVTPYLVFGCMTAAAGLLPLFTQAPLAFAADLIFFVYLFGLARVFTVLAGLDAGSAFGGMGSSREMMVAVLVEPGLMLVLFAAALRAGTTNLSDIITRFSSGGFSTLTPSHLLGAAGIAILVVAETGRLPVDNPDTHLELTMIHEGMLLEYSGRSLALMLWATNIKQLLIISLAVNLFVPWGITASLEPVTILIGLLFYLLKVLGVAAALGLVEMLRPKVRLFKLPVFMLSAFILAFLAVVADNVVR